MTFKINLFTEEEQIESDMALNQCPMKVQKIKESELMLSKSHSKVMSLKDVFRKAGISGEGRGTAHALRFQLPEMAPQVRTKQKLKRFFFNVFYYFELKKETRRKRTNVSQLAIRISIVSRKHMAAFLFLCCFPLKPKQF